MMILIDVVQMHPEFNKQEPKKIPLESHDHSAPGYVTPSKVLTWRVSVFDPVDGNVDLVTVKHNEAVDPEIKDVIIKNSSRFYVTTPAKTIIKEIVKFMNGYHN